MALVQGESTRMLLLTVGPTDSPTYELSVFPVQSRGGDSLDNFDPIRGSAVAVAFVARNKFAVLDRSKQVASFETRNLKCRPLMQSSFRSPSELSTAAESQALPRPSLPPTLTATLSFLPL